MSFFLVGLGAGNRDMNLNMVFSFQLAGRVRTYSAPPRVLMVVILECVYAATSCCKWPIRYDAVSRESCWKVEALNGLSMD